MTRHAPTAQNQDLYGREYQQRQAQKFRQRRENHWRARVELAHRLVDGHALPRLGGRPAGSVTVLDVGCSIGTFAIEFALRGFRAIGVDYDAAALEVARELAREEGAEAEFIRADVADLPEHVGRADIVVCFDLFEHLFDDQIGALLFCLRRRLSGRGSLVFHTFPTEHDYLFFDGDRPGAAALAPHAGKPPEQFDRLARLYACLHDAFLVASEGRTHREKIRPWQHCNPLTADRLAGMLERAGFDVPVLESAQLYPFEPELRERFAEHRICDRNLYGVATPRVR